MSTRMYGPVRRAAGILGLLALAPTGIGLLSGTLTPADAAIRACVTLVAARIVARVVSWWLRGAVERPRPLTVDSAPGTAGTDTRPGAPSQRRSTDSPTTTS